MRRSRVSLFKRFAKTRRGKKLLLDFLPETISEVTVDCGDHRMVVVPHEMIGRHVIANGEYTRGSVGEVLRELDARGLIAADGNCVLEVGSNIGTHTVYLALTGRFDSIVAVEPDPRNVALLRRNLALNGLEPKVQVVPCAAGEEEGELSLYRVEGNWGNGSLVASRASADAVKVPVRPVDAILQDVDVASEAISLVWMDIEGFEPVAVRSMRTLLDRAVPIYMEFSPDFYGPQGTRDFVDFLGQYYSTCIVSDRGKREQRPVSGLASLTRQCDVLFLPQEP